MQIHIHRDGQAQGPYSLEDVRSQLAAGTLQPETMAWYQGAPDWRPLSAMPEIASGTPPPLAGLASPAGTLPQTSGLAITSMVLGILAFLTAGLTAIPAVICGHVSRASIKKSAGAVTGEGFALTGLILGYAGFAILAVAVLAGMMVPVMLSTKKNADRLEAMANAKSIGCTLLTFELDYGMLPCDASAGEVKKKNPETNLTLGNASSNDYFRQLIAGGCVDTEMVFYAKTAACHRPDGCMDGDEALKKGECGFSYILGAATNTSPPQPMVVTPLIPGTDRFDPQPFGRKAIIVWTDGSSQLMPIDSNGHVLDEGANLLDPSHPVWQGKTPRIAWPE